MIGRADRDPGGLPVVTFLRIVWAVLLNGALLGAVVAGFVVARRPGVAVPDGSGGPPPGVPLVSALALMVVVFGQLLYRVLPARATKAARDKWQRSAAGTFPPESLLLAVVRQEWLIGVVVLDVLAWVMLAAYLTEGAASDLVITGFIMAQLACQFPSRSWFDSWVARAREEWARPAEPAA